MWCRECHNKKQHSDRTKIRYSADATLKNGIKRTLTYGHNMTTSGNPLVEDYRLHRKMTKCYTLRFLFSQMAKTGSVKRTELLSTSINSFSMRVLLRRAILLYEPK